jgi:hypothetical protein
MEVLGRPKIYRTLEMFASTFDSSMQLLDFEQVGI